MAKRSTKGKKPDKVKPVAPSVKAKLTEEMARAPKVVRLSQQLSIDFLEVELETGLTFATVARTYADPRHKGQARARAMKAYYTLLERLPKIDTQGDSLMHSRSLEATL